jgi:hypothetical protein
MRYIVMNVGISLPRLGEAALRLGSFYPFMEGVRLILVVILVYGILWIVFFIRTLKQ